MASFDSALRAHQAGRLDEAEALYEAVLGPDPGHATALQMLGVLHAQRGDFARARARIDAAIDAQPDNATIWVSFAEILNASAKAAAGVQFRDALSSHASPTVPLVDIGRRLLARNLTEEATAAFELALADSPGSAAALEGLGAAKQRLGDDAAAIDAFEQAIARDPNSRLAHANLGTLLLQVGRLDDAIAQIRGAITLIPGLAGLHANLGQALCQSGQADAAIAAYDTALGLDPYMTQATAGKIIAQGLRDNDHAAVMPALDYDRILAGTQITHVPGYASVAAFNDALVDAVLKDPDLTSDPSDKTTRIGAQTGELLGPRAGPFAALETLLSNTAATYLRHLASLGSAFPVPVPAQWTLSAWGTVLDSGGHQEPHNHPGQFASGVYYVQMPDRLDPAGGPDQGAIEFGRPPAALGPPPGALKLVRPRTGMLVLFPSYLWHRTIPCHGDRPRISIAFDIQPLAGA